MYSKLTVQFYYLRSLWTRCCSWCNGRSTVLSTVRWKDIAHVHFTDRLILAACIVASKNLSWISTENFQECTAFLDRFRCESCWRHFLEASAVPSLHRLRSHCNCGIQKELNWIEYRGSEKISQSQLSVHFSSRCNLFSVVFCMASSSLGKAMFSLLRGLHVAVCRLGDPLCCSLGISVRGPVIASEEFSPARIFIHFLNAELLCLLFWVSCVEGNCLWWHR